MHVQPVAGRGRSTGSSTDASSSPALAGPRRGPGIVIECCMVICCVEGERESIECAIES